MKHLLLALVFLPSLAHADFLEIRKVVSATPGAKTFKVPKSGEEIALSPELIVSERHIANAHPFEETRGSGPGERKYYSVSVVLNEEGEDRMIAATKDGKPGEMRIAILIEEKIVAAPRIMSVPLGKNFIIDLGEAAQEAQISELAKKLQPKPPETK